VIACVQTWEKYYASHTPAAEADFLRGLAELNGVIEKQMRR
jgi:hypothetical protein